jgi:hypothetical protein
MSTRSAEYEKRAKRILQHLRTDIRYDHEVIPPPFFFEFTGSPSAGKSTTIDEMYKFLRRLGFRTYKPQEGAEVIQHIPRTTPVYNVRTTLYAQSLLLDQVHQHTYDIVLLDRGMFDSVVWMMYWRDKDKLSIKDQRLIQDFFLMPFWTSKISAAYFMVCEAAQAIQREQRIALSERLGETTNPETVIRLVQFYRNAYRDLKPAHPQLEMIDTTALSEQEMVEIVGTKILATMESRVTS